MQGPIDVRRQAPEPFVDVLAFGALDPLDEPEWHMACRRDDGHWQLTDSEPMELHHVTHWLPLPPDPRPGPALQVVA